MGCSDNDRQKHFVALKTLKDKLLNDTKAPLYTYRKQNNYFPVIGEGNHCARIMFVGEAPGENEAKTGHPFCGAAGKFLTTLLESIGFKREDVYITNIVKDRPPGNRDPLPEEIEYYAPYLNEQIGIIAPACVVTLGRHSMKYMFPLLGLSNELQPISVIHGKAFIGSLTGRTISLVTLYHPAVALYNGGMRATLLKDFAILKNFVE